MTTNGQREGKNWGGCVIRPPHPQPYGHVAFWASIVRMLVVNGPNDNEKSKLRSALEDYAGLFLYANDHVIGHFKWWGLPTGFASSKLAQRDINHVQGYWLCSFTLLGVG
jgi:hypothetical protein